MMGQDERTTVRLEDVASPADVRALAVDELPALCAQIRRTIIERSAAIGGHVGSNLGIVELTVALHHVFRSPEDKLVFDVSHQTYAHKMLTGRAAAFLDPARYDEVSGFSNPAESEHDLFAMGHTSTSVSLACGLAKARDVLGQDHDVVAVIGDGSLSGGLALEGLDSLAELGSGVIVVLNDNDQSIAENHGGLYASLAELRRTHGTSPDNPFRALGLDYRYLEEGNDVRACVAALAKLRHATRPVVLHVRTRKGLGFSPAERDEEAWHHVGPFDASTGERQVRAGETYASLTGEWLERRMGEDPHLVAVSSATPYVMGFTPERRERAGRRFVDVGIAEEHAVTFATGLARGGANVIYGVYGTFLQRAYDELWHDLCLNSAPATLLVFGCSAHGTTDATHLGLFDIPVLGTLPRLRYLAPTCKEEYLAMLAWATSQRERPVAIRVPVGAVTSRPGADVADGYDEVRFHVEREGSEVAVLALGGAFELGERACDELAARTGVRATLVNPRFATELDEGLLAGLARDGHRVFVTIEDSVRDGGFGERVAARLAREGAHVLGYGLPRAFPDRYDPAELLASCGMTAEGIAADVIAALAAR